MHEQFQRPLLSPTTRGVHHLALCTDDLKATIDFYVEVLGMPLVHAMKVPPGLGTGPGNRGNPPYEQVLITSLIWVMIVSSPSSRSRRAKNRSATATLLVPCSIAPLLSRRKGSVKWRPG